MNAARTPLLARGSWPEARRIATLLRRETVGGALLLVAAALALAAANSPLSTTYADLRDLRVGPAALHLDLSLGAWAADGLLAIFFFVVGLELKREFVAGDLRDPRRAALPVAAAIGGMVVPAVVFVAVNAGTDAVRGWAVPTATDIAFALAVLAVISSHLPLALRTFLLTLAVVDDLFAVTIIAIFFTADLQVLPLLLALVPLGLFGVLVQRRVRSWWLLIPLAVLTWVLVHESGVHATIAGVLLAFTVPVLRADSVRVAAREVPHDTGDDATAFESKPVEEVEGPGLAEHLEHRIRPLSAGIAVPVFAFFAAGVTVGGLSGFLDAVTDRVALGVVAGMVVGKTVGIAGAAWLTARFTRASLDPDLRWVDVLGVASLAGIGFTVSLLIGDLAFVGDTERQEAVKVGVLCGSLLAGAVASVLLTARNRAYRRIEEAEQVDDDGDGVPDVYQRQTS
ncbi:Na+/H+ antiporter NhaA [Angustibacter speluncae]